MAKKKSKKATTKNVKNYIKHRIKLELSKPRTTVIDIQAGYDLIDYICGVSPK